LKQKGKDFDVWYTVARITKQAAKKSFSLVFRTTFPAVKKGGENLMI